MKNQSKKSNKEIVALPVAATDVTETVEFIEPAEVIEETTLATELTFEDAPAEGGVYEDKVAPAEGGVYEDVPVVEPVVETVVEPVVETVTVVEPVVETVTVVEEPAAQLPPPPAVVIIMPDVDEVEEFINKLGITTSYQVYTASAKAGLIASQWLKDGTNFFERSYGERAGKKHLRNWAPLISLRTFIEIGLSYHVSKQTVSEVTKRAWAPFPNKLSYALLGMAVMTEREPAMSTGVYSNIGPSFKKHQQAAWTEWFHNNALFNTVKTEITAEPVIDVVLEPAVEVAVEPTVETVETIEAELQEVIVTAKAKRGTRKAKEQAAA